MRMIKKLPTSDEIIQTYPLSEKGMAQVANDRKEVKDILSGQDKRKIVIVGPCSAWPYNPVLEFGRRLKAIDEKVNKKLKLILRVYIQKPRTKLGWTGPVNQPDPYQVPDIEEGIKYTRSLMVKLVEMGLPIADEALFTHNAKGFLELLSWVAIGARSVEDQEHRVFASSIACPVGMKNATTGEYDTAINGIVAAQNKHTAVFDGHQVETLGNKYAHLVLRGGLKASNYSAEYLKNALQIMKENDIKNPAIIVDASHDNCRLNGDKDCKLQTAVAHEVLDILIENPEIKEVVKGIMFESFIKGGNQKIEDLTSDTVDKDGLSITDPCMSWEETEQILLELTDRL